MNEEEKEELGARHLLPNGARHLLPNQAPLLACAFFSADPKKKA